MPAEFRTLDGGFGRVCPVCDRQVFSAVPAAIIGRRTGASYANAGVPVDSCLHCVVDRLHAA